MGKENKGRRPLCDILVYWKCAIEEKINRLTLSHYDLNSYLSQLNRQPVFESFSNNDCKIKISSNNKYKKLKMIIVKIIMMIII